VHHTDLDDDVRLVDDPPEMVHEGFCGRVLEHDARVERHVVCGRGRLILGRRVEVCVVRGRRRRDVGERLGRRLSEQEKTRSHLSARVSKGDGL
jgi:hypothetical protein